MKGRWQSLKEELLQAKSIKNYGAVIIVRDIAHAVKLSNDIAPEHLEIMTEKPAAVLPEIKNAGAIFLGRWTPETLGDYSAGPNHTLPTGGTARFFFSSRSLRLYQTLKSFIIYKRGFYEDCGDSGSNCRY